MVINIVAFYIEEFQTHFGPEQIHKTSSLGYYIKKFGLEKATDKLKYDILIQDEDLEIDIYYTPCISSREKYSENYAFCKISILIWIIMFPCSYQ